MKLPAATVTPPWGTPGLEAQRPAVAGRAAGEVEDRTCRGRAHADEHSSAGSASKLPATTAPRRVLVKGVKAATCWPVAVEDRRRSARSLARRVMMYRHAVTSPTATRTPPRRGGVGRQAEPRGAPLA